MQLNNMVIELKEPCQGCHGSGSIQKEAEIVGVTMSLVGVYETCPECKGKRFVKVHSITIHKFIKLLKHQRLL